MNFETFKPGVAQWFFGLLWMIIGCVVFLGIGVFAIEYFWFKHYGLYIAAVVILLLFVFFEIRSLQMHVDLYDDGTLEYYGSGGKLKHKFNVNDISIDATTRSSSGTLDSISFDVLDHSNGKKYSLDFTPLGRSRFNRLFEKIKVIAPPSEDSIAKAKVI